MTQVTLFGTGNMGSAISAIFEASGASVQHVNTSTPAPAELGDVVILATPATALPEILAAHADQLAGKIVVDITNPVDFQTFQLTVRNESSAAAQLAEALPHSRVLKAFNTNFSATLAPASGTSVLVAGDDADAKEVVIQAVNAAGLKGLDAGALDAARELEAFAYLQMQLTFGGKAAGFTVNAA